MRELRLQYAVRRPARRVPALAALLVVMACEGSYAGPGGVTGGEPKRLVYVAVAATPIEVYDSLVLWTSQVQLVKRADTTVRYAVTRTPRMYDLLDLADTISAPVGPVSVPIGDYTLRLVVDSARLRFRPPRTFVTGDSARTLPIPVAQRAGVDVVLPVTVSADVTLVIVVDAARSILFAGSLTQPSSALLRPVLHAVADTAAASAAGTVNPATHAVLYGVVGEDTVSTALADTVSGAWKLRLLPPGSVTIIATGTGLAAQKTLTLRAGQDTTGVAIP